MSNPLVRKPRLEPIRGSSGTTSDIQSRLRGAMHPGESIMAQGTKPDYKLQVSTNSNMYKTSAPVHLNIAAEDNLSADTRDSKTPYETIAFEPLNKEPLEHFTLIESKIQNRLKNWEVLKNDEAKLDI